MLFESRIITMAHLGINTWVICGNLQVFELATAQRATGFEVIAFWRFFEGPKFVEKFISKLVSCV